MNGKLFVVSGPSGAGKGTLCSRVLALRDDVYFSISCTTRDRRANETDGVHYHFITEAAFLALRDAGGLLECSHHAGAWYGTPRDRAIEQIARGMNVLLEIENNGALQVIRSFPETISVFVLPPSRAELIRRLVERKTESRERIRERLAKVPSELEAAKGYTHLIANDAVEPASNRLNEVFGRVYRDRTEDGALLASLAREFADTDATNRALDEIYAQYRTE